MLAVAVFSLALAASCVHAQDGPLPIVFTPTFGTLMGGDELVFTAPNITSSGGQVYCRFGVVDQVTVAGVVGPDGLTRCVTPVLYEIGRVPFQVSVDGGSTYSYGANFTAVLGMEGVNLVDRDSKWQRPIKSATSPLDLAAWRELIQEQLTLTWDRDSFDSASVNVELWGYKEEGSQASWDFMYSVARQVPNTGTYTFSPESTPDSVYHTGKIRVSGFTQQEGVPNIRALWSNVHALAWQFKELFYQDPVTWSTQRCMAWREAEKDLPNFVPDMPPCPCTLQQALVDTGRFQEEGSQASWDFMYSVARQVPNTGTYTFSPESTPDSVYHTGKIRVSGFTQQEGVPNIRALWSNVHALAWQFEELFYQDPVTWSTQRCMAWREAEKDLPNFVPDMPPCPCTLQQALVDTGRFQLDTGCALSLGSTCTYHPGAVHCVRSIAASPDGAGQQCCYAADGRELFTGDTAGGSTPDRGHVFGAPPYRVPPRVPSYSHWIHDVTTFYYCCLWSDNCDVYFELRPTDDCTRYVPPKAGAVFGDPHVITLDGRSYTFNGLGEYTLLQADDIGLRIQVRTAQVSNAQGELVHATACSSFAMREGASDTVEVRLPRARDTEVPQVLVNGEVVRFDTPVITLSGVYVASVVPSNVTVHFQSGVGVEVRSEGGLLTALVLVPPQLKSKTQGLLGSWNDNPDDDFTTPSGDTVPSTADQMTIYNDFGASCELVHATACSSFAMREGASDTVEVRLPRARDTEVPQVLVNGEVVRFDTPVITLSGVYVASVVPSNVTVHFQSGVGVEVRSEGGLLTALVLVPPQLKSKATFHTSLEVVCCNLLFCCLFSLHQRLLSKGAITSQTSLFVYSAQEEAMYADKHDPDFTPIVNPPALPAESAEGRRMAQICGDNDQCVFDFTATRNEVLAASTRWAHDWYQAVSKDTRKVATCPYVPTPEHGSKVGGPSYVENGAVTIACNEGYTPHPTRTVTCRRDGTWDGVPGTCVASNTTTAAVAGGVIGGVAVLCVVIGLLVWRMRDDKESTRSEDYRDDSKKDSTQET
uniref:Sushi domain-containing protein n=1 Tax=Branchiostoma floridae TaxID=7739 RepID=C3YIN5_BRAFL|eukprot:XP_002603748.1 hypothetical protein BRAFLDRAFT_97609 [Branchiostoma floridae]